MDKKAKILDFLRENPGGSSITDISKGTGFSRNTIPKYLLSLEHEKKAYNREVRHYKLYFATERKFLPRKTASSFYKGLLSSLKAKLPRKEEFFKEIGKDIAKTFKFPLGISIKDQLTEINQVNIKEFFDTFGKLYPNFDIFQDSVDISELRFNQQGNKATYKLIHSELLETNDDYVYHFYVVCGFIEATLSRELNKKVVCKIETVEISKDKSKSFVELSIEVEL